MQVIFEDQLSLVRPEGALDSASSQSFEEEIFSLLEDKTTNIIIDLAAVEFVGSASLRVFMRLSKSLAAKNRALRLCGLKGMVRETFEISGFCSIMDICDSETEARAGWN